jgi:AcrR family transcriptional regulator
LPTALKSTLHPRKTPLQDRSAATVAAILQATLQVLIGVGKERLTTTRVAARAGVSVGTLYQYFPNKSSLLQACLKRHMAGVSKAVEEVCEQYQNHGILEIATALIAAFLLAKMRDGKESAALYSVSSDVDGQAIAKAISVRSHRLVANLLASAREGLNKDPEIVAAVVLAALYGVARRMLEGRLTEPQAQALRAELVVLTHAYLRTCTRLPVA